MTRQAATPGSRRAILAIITIVVMLLAHQRAATACACSDPGAFGTALTWADAIFVGKVKSVRPVRRKAPRMVEANPGYREVEVSIEFQIVEYSVLDVLKPFNDMRAGTIVRIAASVPDEPCSHPVDVGQTHLIASSVDVQYRAMMDSAPLLSVSPCSDVLLLPEGVVAPWTAIRNTSWPGVALAVWRAATTGVRAAKFSMWPVDGR